MCGELLAQVVSVDTRRGEAVVDRDGRRSLVSLAVLLVQGHRVREGDWVRVHTGVVLDVVGGGSP